MERSILDITHRDRKTNVWVRENAKTLLNKSEVGSGPGQLKYDVVQGVSRCGYEVCVHEVWKCVLLFFNNRLLFKGITIFYLQKHNRAT